MECFERKQKRNITASMPIKYSSLTQLGSLLKKNNKANKQKTQTNPNQKTNKQKKREGTTGFLNAATVGISDPWPAPPCLQGPHQSTFTASWPSTEQLQPLRGGGKKKLCKGLDLKH